MFNLQMVNKIAVLLTSFGLITGCAPLISGAMNATVTDEVVISKTAKYFGTSQKNVIILRIEKGALNTSYQAKHAGKFYNCSIYYGEVSCKQPGG